MDNEISLPRGTSLSIGIWVQDADGQPYYDSGDTVRFGVKYDPDDTAYAVDKTASCATLLTALRVFSEADLLEVEMTDDRLCLQCKPTTQKADLNATPTMQYLVG
jgi:hypothetical protein